MWPYSPFPDYWLVCSRINSWNFESRTIWAICGVKSCINLVFWPVGGVSHHFPLSLLVALLYVVEARLQLDMHSWLPRAPQHFSQRSQNEQDTTAFLLLLLQTLYSKMETYSSTLSSLLRPTCCGVGLPSTPSPHLDARFFLLFILGPTQFQSITQEPWLKYEMLAPLAGNVWHRRSPALYPFRHTSRTQKRSVGPPFDVNSALLCSALLFVSIRWSAALCLQLLKAARVPLQKTFSEVNIDMQWKKIKKC